MSKIIPSGRTEYMVISRLRDRHVPVERERYDELQGEWSNHEELFDYAGFSATDWWAGEQLSRS